MITLYSIKYCLNFQQQYIIISASNSEDLYLIPFGFKVLLTNPSVPLFYLKLFIIWNSSSPIATFDASMLMYNGYYKCGNAIIISFTKVSFLSETPP